MKFRAKRDYGTDEAPRLKKGITYDGQFIATYERTQQVPQMKEKLKVVVYDETDKWNDYDPDFFEPAN